MNTVSSTQKICSDQTISYDSYAFICLAKFQRVSICNSIIQSYFIRPFLKTIMCIKAVVLKVEVLEGMFLGQFLYLFVCMPISRIAQNEFLFNLVAGCNMGQARNH